MTMRMLVDARHPEETRVAVVEANRIEEFDFESAEHKQLKGNIYLAKVTRVEPSLQAAFVDYGGNRHGFLAFSEIHPDYYQIPREDREALLREEMEHAQEEARLRAGELDHDDDDLEIGDDLEMGDDLGMGDGGIVEIDEDPGLERPDDEPEGDAEVEIEGKGEGEGEPAARTDAENGSDESAEESLRTRRQNLRRRYKIQDVIKRRQVLLVQVVKEERGNKGAALTTYLSLAGRYCVLMPNTSHGGGISRKISNGADRKRLKQIMADLDLPGTMGLIVRTAGLQRTKIEIKRDFDYLARLWDEIRENTLKSAAPALIYQDSDLIKRAIRDVYSRDIEEIQVEGEEGHRHARAFMKLLMPSHVRRVKQYVDPVPLFQRYGVEDQLSGMYQPVVQLRSGGYLVINPTEALVSIDINSGRSTREHNIEQTAYATNIEAAHEIARQLRLRDMAGLVVIDFIDMESSSHIRKVEKTMKDALKNDRARIQVGRISSFGLMEMSRQRLRTGVLEASTKPCPHCEGSGLMRTAASSGLSALRMLEDEAARGRGSRIVLRAGREAAVYLLNRKRGEIGEVEARYGVFVEVVIDESLEGARMSVEAIGPPPAFRPAAIAAPVVDEADEADAELDEDEEEEVREEVVQRADRHSERPDDSERGERDGSGESGRKRRRRRGRRGGRRQPGEEQREAAEGDEADTGLAGAIEAAVTDDMAGAESNLIEAADLPADALADDPDGAPAQADVAPDGDAYAQAEQAQPKRARRRPRARKAEPVAGAPSLLEPADAPVSADPEQAAPAETAPFELAPFETPPAGPVPVEAANDETPAPPPPKRPRGRPRKVAVDLGAAPVAEAPPTPAADEEVASVDAAPANDTEALPPAGNGGVPAEAPEAPMLERQSAEGDDMTEDRPPGPGEPPRRGWWQRTFGG